MKRIALLTVLLLVVSLAAFAVDVKPTVALTGTASVTWGYDLDTGNTGFLNTADASFTLNLLAADGTDTHAGTGDMYGSITLSNVEFYWTDSGTPVFGPADTDISAKIVITPFEIGVYAAPGMTQDFFGALEDADVPDQVVNSDESAFGMVGSGFATNYGTWVTATFGPAVVTLKIVSDGDWTKAGTAAVAAGADTYGEPFKALGTETSDGTGDYIRISTGQDAAAGALVAGEYYLKRIPGAAAVPATTQGNNYAFGGEAVLTFKPLTVSAGGYYGSNEASFYGKIALDMAPIVAWGALEANMPSSGLVFGAGGGLTFTIVEGTTLAATAWYGDNTQGLDLNVVFTEPGDKGLIPGLDTVITFNLLDVGTVKASEWELVTATGFKIGLNSDATNYARPYVNFTYGMNNDSLVLTSTGTTVMYAEAGVQLQVIPLTLLTAKWVSGNKIGADLAASTPVLGSLQFVATVTY